MRNDDVFADPAITNDPELTGARDRIFAFGMLLDRLLLETPASLVALPGLNAMEQHMPGVLSELAGLQSTRNTGHLNNAASHMENVQPYLWAFAPTSLPSGSSLSPEIFADQSDAARKAIGALVASRDDASGRLHTLRTEVDKLAQELRDLTEVAARERAEAATTVAKLETVFAKEQLERDAANAAALGLLDTNFKSFISNATTDSTTLIKEISDKKDQAAQIVQVVGNIGVTGNYQQIATAEAGQANLWRWVTVTIFGIGIAVAVATFWRYWGEPVSGVNAASIAVRLLYAIAITAPAWYTAKESARHRTNADRAKQTELELASIGPFIELMPVEKKNAIREEMTKRYFGNGVEAHTVDHPIKISDFKDLLVEGIKAARSA
jgi:hypothetical protein